MIITFAMCLGKEMRLSLICDLENHLRDIPVDELSPEKRYCAIKGVCQAPSARVRTKR